VTLLTAGAPLAEAEVAVVLLHGRGASAEDILGLAPALSETATASRVAFLAPAAPGGTWYPLSFLAPIERNEPALGRALGAVSAAVARCEEAGLAAGRVVLAGFSQGACLASEFAARHPRRWGAVVAWTGGRIGPLGTAFPSVAGFEGTPVLLACGDPDPHIPWRRVEESALFFEDSGAAVTLRRRPGQPHSVHPDDVALARGWIAALAG
jgi:predicted esterase